MSYLTVTTLTEAKNYLRIDDSLTEDDSLITTMINAAWQYIETYTNVLVYARDKKYKLIDGCERIYDFPINSITETVETEEKHLYSIISYGSSTVEINANVGYTLPTDVPSDLKKVALQIIDSFYYDKGDGKTIEQNLSALSINILNQNKRFLL